VIFLKTLLIIPAYNEEQNIENTLSKISGKYDYVVINDGSIDNTKDILEKNNYNHINLIRNLGIGGAVQTGYKYALENDYDIAIQFDADGQHDAESIPDLIDPIVSGKADFTIGSRFVGNKSRFKSTKSRQLGINLISLEIKLFSKKTIKDVTSGFRAANKNIIRKFACDYPSEYPEPISNYKLLKEGYNVEEISVKMHERKAGKSSIGSWKNVYYMFNVMLSIFIEKLRRNKNV
jgi:glycosyltransferase involved in cell wall biosynthesis